MEVPKPLVFGAGLLIGVALGYGGWGYQNVVLEKELAKTKAWLMDEIQRSDARQQQQREQQEAALKAAQDALTRVRAELARTKDDLARTQGILKEAVSDWRSERQRRRALEQELATTYRAPVRPADRE